MKFMIERKKSIIIIINIYYVGLRGKPKLEFSVDERDALGGFSLLALFLYVISL